MSKKWYSSKTLWVNSLAAIAVIIQAITGETWLNAELQAAIIILVNLALRAITKSGLEA